MSDEISAPVEHPATLAGYDLLDKIGEGGMGQVHRATQLSLGRTVAIKFLNPLSAEFGERALLHRESRVMAALAHPHVATIYARCFSIVIVYNTMSKPIEKSTATHPAEIVCSV